MREFKVTPTEEIVGFLRDTEGNLTVAFMMNTDREAPFFWYYIPEEQIKVESLAEYFLNPENSFKGMSVASFGTFGEAVASYNA